MWPIEGNVMEVKNKEITVGYCGSSCSFSKIPDFFSFFSFPMHRSERNLSGKASFQPVQHAWIASLLCGHSIEAY